MVGIHSPGFEPARERNAVEAAVKRLGIAHPVLLDPDLEMWREYENEGWPARYLFDGRGVLFDYHYGEGAYEETELAIQELLGIEREPLAPLRPEDAPDARLEPQSEDREGAYSGPYEAGGVWGVLDGEGTRARQRRRAGGHTPGGVPAGRARAPHRGGAGVEVGPGVECLATCFTPGLAPVGPPPPPVVLPLRTLLSVRRGRRAPQAGASSACVRASSRRRSTGGPSSSTSTQLPGQ